MKRLVRTLSLLALLISLAPAQKIGARTPYTTWALGPGWYFFLTQDAYTPLTEIDLSISGPEDFFFTPDGTLYVADTGNGRILRLGRDYAVQASYGEGVLDSPTGLYIDQDGTMYIADAGSDTIVILDRLGNLVSRFGRPSELLFGVDNEFLPRKIAVDARRNLYIVSEGSTNGLVVMNTDGHFIGYFGANPANMSLKMILQRMFLNEEQLAQFIKNEAASPSNVTIDFEAMIFSVTAGTTPENSIRRYTVAGRNVFPMTAGSGSFRDVHVSENGLVTAVDADGEIFEYDLLGMPLFLFGAKDQGDQRLGALRNPTAVERYQNRIYVLDKDKNAIVIYQSTHFADLVHDGVRLYMKGYYLEARPYFEEVLRYNGSFIMAYKAIADAYFKAGDYQNALVNYRYAEDRHGYSEAYWELRNAVLQRDLAGGILALAGLFVIQGLWKRFDRRHGWTNPLKTWFVGLSRRKWVDDLLFLFSFIKHPTDGYYYIKKKQRGSLGFALLIYLWVVIVRVSSLYLTGFIFNRYANFSQIRAENEIAYILLFLFLWNVANYLVSTISDGEGRVRDVVIGTAYSLFPYALFALPLVLLSNLLSMNEKLLFTFSFNVIWAWTGLMFFLMVKEIHNYSFGETVRNVFMTIFTIAIMLLTGYILYVLFFQLFDFIGALFREVQLRG
ncbi:MAG: DUF1282 domain-containing protein [Chloroflexi bacterium]|nr:DUF1282 domain-containing protein [Chloroflexota bacterium]